MNGGEIPVAALLWSPALLLIPAGLLWFYRVRLIRDAAIATVRMAVQFAFVGAYLGFVFRYNQPWLTILWTVLIVVVAAQTALHRATFSWREMGLPLCLALAVGLLVPLVFIMVLVERELPFLTASTTIPFCGMIMGHVMKNAIIALRTLKADVKERRREIQYALALGATRTEALRASFRRGMTDALAPHIANMAAAGLVILPGMMTGVMIGGASPVAAVEYQWLLLLAVFAAKSITIALAMELAIRGNRLAPELK